MESKSWWVVLSQAWCFLDKGQSLLSEPTCCHFASKITYFEMSEQSSFPDPSEHTCCTRAGDHRTPHCCLVPCIPSLCAVNIKIIIYPVPTNVKEVCLFTLLFKKTLKKISLFIFREGKGRRKGEKHRMVACSTHPDWEVNWQPFTLQNNEQPTG